MARYGYLIPTRGSVLESDDRETLAARTAADVVGLAERAEAIGLDSVWVGDSVLAKPRHDAFSTLAALSTATEAVDLGTAVHLPALRHPVHVAHQTATIDQLSGGRLRFGVGVGRGSAVAAEHAALDVPFGERGARLDELLEVVTGLWGGEPIDYEGEFYQLRDASIGFEPVREPPIYVASAAFDPAEGFPRRIRERLLEHGGGWLPIGVDPDTYAQGLDRIRSALTEAGRSSKTFDPALYLNVVVDDDESRAIESARRFYDRYYPSRGMLTEQQIRDLGAFGPAADVAETLAAYRDAGVERFVVRFTSRDQRTQLRRFTDVIA
jgi:alkanesulfonate monooxygenase SsuD/methylene tetrahydromethanopterin reductase-like flavin-dependent oxidoreductase (luciferase family)